MIDRVNLFILIVLEMTVFVGGMRVLNANSGNSKYGIFTKRSGVLILDFFVNLFDMFTEWIKSDKEEGIYEGCDRKTGKVKWIVIFVDFVFGLSSELRLVGEVYVVNDGCVKFVCDFVKAWIKVMRLDCFDLK